MKLRRLLPYTAHDAWLLLVADQLGGQWLARVRPVDAGSRQVPARPAKRGAHRIGEDPSPAVPKAPRLVRLDGVDGEPITDPDLLEDIVDSIAPRPPARWGTSQGDYFERVRRYNADTAINWWIYSEPTDLYGSIVTEYPDGVTRYDLPLAGYTRWTGQDFDITATGRENWYTPTGSFKPTAEIVAYYVNPLNLALLGQEHGAAFYAQVTGRTLDKLPGDVEEGLYHRIDRYQSALGDKLYGAVESSQDLALRGAELLTDTALYQDLRAGAKGMSDRADKLVDAIPFIVGAVAFMAVASAAAVAIATATSAGAVTAGAGAYAFGYGGLGQFARAYAATKGV